MKELGNLVFGHSSFHSPVPRTPAYENVFYELVHALSGKETEFYGDYVSDLFDYHPYYWGDCTCGFEEKLEFWEDSHFHSNTCYHTVVRERINSYMASFPVLVNDFHDRLTMEHEIAKEVAKEMGLPSADGFMSICTCEYRIRHMEYTSTHTHSADCRIIWPNFFFKPTGYMLEFYKYPLRDSYASRDLNPEEFKQMIDQCIAFVKEHPHGH